MDLDVVLCNFSVDIKNIIVWSSDKEKTPSPKGKRTLVMHPAALLIELGNLLYENDNLYTSK
jgi:hypothetical protein